MAVRHATEVTQGVPILITENGIATADDSERIRYTAAALQGLLETIADGIDVRGYLHWSLLDNFEWGHWEPTFGLIAVDRDTFERTPKPSLAWLGQVAQHNAHSHGGARVSFPFADVSAAPVGDLLSLAGRRALVTGGGRRALGKAIALRLAEAGADVAIADIDDALARAAASDISSRFGTGVVGVRMDVTDAASVRAGTEQAVSAVRWPGRLDQQRGCLPQHPGARDR